LILLFLFAGVPLFPAHAVMSTIAPSSVTAAAGFNGLNEKNSNCCNFTPPDVQIGVGPNYVMEMTNDARAVYNKQGGIQTLQSFSAFFGTGNDFVSDPRVLYDSQSQRWFATVVHCVGTSLQVGNCGTTQNRVEIAVSSSSDPLGSWQFYNVSASRDGLIPDQPIIGLSTDKFVVSVNINGISAEWWIFNKNDLVAGLPTEPKSFGPYAMLQSVHPVQSPTTTLYMVTTGSAERYASSWANVTLFTVPVVPAVSNSSITNSTLTLGNPVTKSPLGSEPSPCTISGVCYVDAGDFRVLDAAWSNGVTNGSIWLGVDSACVQNPSRDCIRLIKVNIAGPSISQEFDFGANGKDYYYPALRVDGTGNLDLIYGFSNSSTYPSLAVSGQAVNDPPGSMTPSKTIINGTIYISATDQVDSRYGDYFGASVDPANSAQVWVAGEYMNRAVGKCGGVFTGPRGQLVYGYCWDTFITSMQEHPAASFTLSTNPSSVTLTCTYYAGCDPASANANLTISNIVGYSGSVTLTYSGPSGPYPYLTGPPSASVSAGGSTTVTIVAYPQGVTAGNYVWTITGSGGGFTTTTTLTIVFYYCRNCV